MREVVAKQFDNFECSHFIGGIKITASNLSHPRQLLENPAAVPGSQFDFVKGPPRERVIFGLIVELVEGAVD